MLEFDITYFALANDEARRFSLLFLLLYAFTLMGLSTLFVLLFQGNQKDPLMSMEFAGFNKRRKTEESV